VASQAFASSSAVVITTIKPSAHFIAPPLKRERPHVHHVPVAYAGSVQKSIDAEFSESMNNLVQSLIVSEILKTYGSTRGPTVNNPAARPNSLHRDFLRYGSVDDNFVLERVGLISPSPANE
jgi:hypothetical protein